jgi:hypothetical protein
VSLAGVARSHSSVQRAVAYLLTTQQPDGSWAMKSRADKSGDPLPISHYGST